MLVYTSTAFILLRFVFTHESFAIHMSDRNSHRHEECCSRNNKIQFFHSWHGWRKSLFVGLYNFSFFLSHSMHEPKILIKKPSPTYLKYFECSPNQVNITFITKQTWLKHKIEMDLMEWISYRLFSSFVQTTNRFVSMTWQVTSIELLGYSVCNVREKKSSAYFMDGLFSTFFPSISLSGFLAISEPPNI